MLNMPGSSSSATSSSPEQDKICHELAELTRQIDHLEMSEHDRLSRELQAVKMRIQEAERQRELVSDASWHDHLVWFLMLGVTPLDY